MPIGAFVDKSHPPTMRELLASVGTKRPLWENLTEFIEDSYQVKSDFRFYGKNYGWSLRFRKGGKALLSLYPGKESFTVQIILNESQVAATSSLKIGKKVRKIIEKTHQFPEGRWLFIRTESEHDLTDVKQLLLLKAKPKAR